MGIWEVHSPELLWAILVKEVEYNRHGMLSAPLYLNCLLSQFDQVMFHGLPHQLHHLSSYYCHLLLTEISTVKDSPLNHFALYHSHYQIDCLHRRLKQTEGHCHRSFLRELNFIY